MSVEVGYDTTYYKDLISNQYRPKIRTLRAEGERKSALIADLMEALGAARGATHPDGMPAVWDEDFAALVARCRALGIEVPPEGGKDA